MTDFEMDSNWICYHPQPSKPAFILPKGAVDAHCHVFGPGDVFPYAAERKYTPCDAPKEKLWELRDHLGFSRNVIVQATCHGADNRALVDALQDAGGRARGVATVKRSIKDDELTALHAAGVRGVRFNFVKRLVNALPRDELIEIVHRIKPFGWHIVIYFEAKELPELYEFFTSLPCAVVVDHMGVPDVTKPVDGPEFDLFLKLMRDHENLLCKVTCPERLSKIGPSGYSDVIPFAQTVCDSFPDRVLWGTDWPHPNMTTHAPDDGGLVDYIPKIARTVKIQQKMLVDNPNRLYWSD
jgi:2-pyrone-4,6-dicarboxylate lactonase